MSKERHCGPITKVPAVAAAGGSAKQQGLYSILEMLASIHRALPWGIFPVWEGGGGGGGTTDGGDGGGTVEPDEGGGIISF
ncbi:MAG TPA: hypothetical protein HPP77_11195 [Candidatus Hydrogenedentes bacterium]|nr:hypothetical protein [Candidatus Hydrogenedentota bacterium]HIJ74503.1 hypothetical protein [Candidatus Hydrogenedentota bacterium]